MSKRRAPVLSIGDTELHTWFERDRQHVELRDKKSERTIVEWWDEEVSEAVEDGFLKPGRWHQTAFDYAADHGLLVRKHFRLPKPSGYPPSVERAYRARLAKRNPRPRRVRGKPDRFGPRVRFNWGYHDAPGEIRIGIYRKYIDGPYPENAPPMKYVSYADDPAYYWGHRFGKEAAQEGTYKNNSEPAWIHFMDVYPDETQKMGVIRTGPAQYKYQALWDGKVVWEKETQPLPGKANPRAPDPRSFAFPSRGGFRVHLEDLSLQEEAQAEVRDLRQKGDEAMITSRRHPKTGRKTYTVWRKKIGRNPNFIYKVVLKSTGQVFRIWADSAKNAIWQVQQQFAHPPLASAFRAARSWTKRPPGPATNASPGWHALKVAEAAEQSEMIGGAPGKPSRQYLLGVQKAHELSIKEAKRNPGRRSSFFAPRFKTVEGMWRALRARGGRMTLPLDQLPLAEKLVATGRARLWDTMLYIPDSQKSPKGNPGTDMASLMATNEFKKGVRLYEQIHGQEPTSVRRVVLPMGGPKITGRAVVVSLGKAPAESYEPRAGSRKAGRIWVHPYERKPEKVVTADGKLIMTLPGSHAVKPGPDGEAWIHG
jgi:hypothetical protein